MRIHEPHVSIVVPVYNEVESIPELVGRITDACETGSLSFEVWLVDDGSRDGSWDAIEAAHTGDARFAGIRMRRNYGKSAALALGFTHVQGKYVITMDADLQDDPDEIPALIAKLEEGYDLVSGWKKARKDPLEKKIASRFFNFVTRVLSGIRLHDFNCGLKAYRAEVVQNVQVYGELHRYIPMLAKWAGFNRITEQVVKHHPRKFGKTKFGLGRYITGFLDLITVIFLTRFAVRPMHFFGLLGTLSFMGGIGISLYLTVLKLMGQPLGNRPLLFLGMLLILLGAQSFFTGFLGEMIIRPRMEDAGTYKVVKVLPPTGPRTGPPVYAPNP